MNFKELAKQAGVSVASVSRVYNGQSGIGEEKRKKIEALLEQNGYPVKEREAAPKKHGKSAKIKLITFIIYVAQNSIIERSEDYFAGILLGAEKAAKELGYVLSIVRVNEQELEEFLSGSDRLKMSQGMILLATEVSGRAAQIVRSCPVPYVVIDNMLGCSLGNSVATDNRQGVYAAIRHLKMLGHSKVGFLAPLCPIGSLPAREQAYYEAMAEMELPVSEEFIVRMDHVLEPGIKTMGAYLEKGPQLPTAFFAANDTIGVAAMIALKQRGILVPEEVSIIGFDDANIGNSSEPRLTTMQVDCKSLGERSVKRLQELLEGDPSVMHMYLETVLLEKESTVGIK